MNDNGWDTWKIYVLEQLKENKEQHEKLIETLNRVDQKLTILQTEHRVGKFLGTTVIAAVVSLIVSVLGRIFGS